MPSKASELCEKGKSLVAQGEYKSALECFDMAIRLDSKHKEAYTEKGQVLLTLGDVEEAIRYFTVTTIIDSNYLPAWLNREAAEVVRGNYEQAVRCLDEVIRIQPDNSSVWLRKGRLLARMNQLSKAAECFNKAVQIDAKYKDILTADENKLIAKFKNLLPQKTVSLSKKICLLGDCGAGKTSLTRRFVYTMFDEKYIATIGAEVVQKRVILSGYGPTPDIEIQLFIWDIAGEQKFDEVRPVYYKGTAGAIIVSDVTKSSTLDSISVWAEHLFKAVGNKVPVIIVGNKCDLKSEATFGHKAIKDMASTLNTAYFFTSAKTGENVESAFTELCKKLI